jgi:hypothetical protein
VKNLAIGAALLFASACQPPTSDHAPSADLAPSRDIAESAPDLVAPSAMTDAATPICDHAARCANATTLERCENGQPVQTPCGPQLSCQTDTVDGGVACSPVPSVVSGKVRYEDRPSLPPGTLGAITPQPARGVSVSLIADQENVVLATGRSEDDGSFSLIYTATAGKSVHLLVAATSDAAMRPVQVHHLNKSVHGFGAASFTATAQYSMDVLVTEASHEAEAFNIFDMMLIAVDTVRLRMGGAKIEPIVATWELGQTDGTYYDGAVMLGATSDDDDGYDDAVILHELGHYVEAIYGRSDSPGGGHGGEATDPRLAWSEGWATYFSSSARRNQFYVDTNAGGGFSNDLEKDVTMAQATGAMTQNVSEELVSQILWDVGDAPTNDDDARSGSDRHDDVMKIQVQYLHTATQMRGVAGVDLVDWLDGWFKQEGPTTCSALRSIVKSRAFPYDFKAPSAACP